MPTNHAEQKQLLPTRQVTLGPMRTAYQSKNLVSVLDITQSENTVDLPGEHSAVELVSFFDPKTVTDYATSIWNSVGIGSCIHYYVVTAGIVTGYQQLHKTANAGAVTDWSVVAYAP